MTVLGIYREQVFSPGKVNEDAAILNCTLEELVRQGVACRAVCPEELDRISTRPRWVLNMAQSHPVLNVLERWGSDGSCIVNSAQSIRNCYRKALLPILKQAQLPLPDSRLLPLRELEQRAARGDSFLGWWLKRGDVHAMAPEDVVRIHSAEGLGVALQAFRRRGVRDLLDDGWVLASESVTFLPEEDVPIIRVDLAARQMTVARAAPAAELFLRAGVALTDLVRPQPLAAQFYFGACSNPWLAWGGGALLAEVAWVRFARSKRLRDFNLALAASTAAGIALGNLVDCMASQPDQRKPE